jgi:hypothetical protein
MHGVTYAYNPDFATNTKPMVELTRIATEVAGTIQSCYEAGEPLFTKHAIKDIIRQLEAADNGVNQISVIGLDGSTVDFAIETGRVLKGPTQDLEFVLYARGTGSQVD